MVQRAVVRELEFNLAKSWIENSWFLLDWKGRIESQRKVDAGKWGYVRPNSQRDGNSVSPKVFNGPSDSQIEGSWVRTSIFCSNTASSACIICLDFTNARATVSIDSIPIITVHIES